MFVYFSTVVRTAPQERGGELIKFDWQHKQIAGRVPIVPAHPAVHDPNPRGSTRGGRGILVDGDEVHVASYHSLCVFDRDLTPRRHISNPLFANLHELSWDADHMWATSTDIDAAVKTDRSGRTLESWWPREDPVLVERYQLQPLQIDKSQDNRTAFVGIRDTAHSHVHLNAVTMQGNRPLMLLNRFGCVVRLKPTEILIDDAQLQGSHNILVTTDGSILVNNTLKRALHVYDANGSLRTRIDLLSFPPVRRLYRRHSLAVLGAWLARHGRPSRVFHPLFYPLATARPIFVRGLCQISERSVLIGISPASLLEVDWQTGELIDFYSYSHDRYVCVHGIAGAGH